MAFQRMGSGGSGGTTVYWSNPTTGEYFYAQTITLSKPCNKICVIWGGNNTSINIDSETITNQYADAGNLVYGVLTLTRGETKTAVQAPPAFSADRGRRSYTFDNDGVSVIIGASSYQQGYQTPCLIFSLE